MKISEKILDNVREEKWFDDIDVSNPRKGVKFKNNKEKKDFFHHWEPDTISWDELKETNYKMWDFLVDIANELIADGRLNSKVLPKKLRGREIVK